MMKSMDEQHGGLPGFEWGFYLRIRFEVWQAIEQNVPSG